MVNPNLKGVTIMLNDIELRQLIMNMRNKVDKLEREGEYWSDAERCQLQQLFDKGTGLTIIAVLLQRTELAVIQQAMLMDLFTPPHKKRKYSPRQPQCLCHNCKLDPTLCPHRLPPMPVQEVTEC